MIVWLAVCLSALLLLRDNMLDMPMYWDYASWQLEMMLIAFMAVFSDGSQRDRSVLSVVALYYAWVAATDQFVTDLPSFVLEYETTIFVIVLFWAFARPYFLPSHERDPYRVAIAFYHGNNAPFLSSLSSLIGLPFSSVSVLAGETAIRPHKCGKLILTKASVYDNNENYTIINTNVVADAKFFNILALCVGNKTKYGFFRVGCVKSIKPILAHCGLEPNNIIQYIPSLFFYRVLGAIK